MKLPVFLIFLALAVAKPCENQFFLDDPGFRSLHWLFDPWSFQTANSGSTGVPVPQGGFILLARTYLSAPSYRASISLNLPNDISSVDVQLSVETSFNSTAYFTLDLSLAGAIWRISPPELASSQGQLIVLNSSLAVGYFNPSFSINVDTAAVDDYWLAITDVKVIGCTTEYSSGLSWWENMLIVLGALAFLAVVAYFMYQGIGLPGARRRKAEGLLPNH